MKRFFEIAFVCLLLAGCATPSTVMKHPKTGNIVRCGGDRTGALAGGLVGYSLQSDDASKCVKDYGANGYVIVPSEK